MNTFNISANSEDTYMLEIIPNCGTSGDVLKLNFVCIDFPVLNTSIESSIEMQTMSTTKSWKLAFLEDAEYEDSASKQKFKIKTIYNVIENSYSDDSEFNSNMEKSNNNFEDTNTILNFIASAGENEGYYKTTIFINNKPVIIDGKRYIDYKLNKYEKLKYEAEVDDNSLKDTSIFYAISIKLDNPIDDWKSQVDVFKTDSIIINR